MSLDSVQYSSGVKSKLSQHVEQRAKQLEDVSCLNLGALGHESCYAFKERTMAIASSLRI